MGDSRWTPKQLAAHWHTSPGVLAQWRYEGRGPDYLKIGRRVLYSEAVIRAYEEKNAVEVA